MPISIFSLTEPGAQLAKKINNWYPSAQCLANVKPFRETVQTHFKQGRPLIMICSTGIVMRILGPVLQSKYHDPAVLVIDDQGRFVVPLLSGHEGGANHWGLLMANMLDAQCIITSAERYSRPLLVAGVGCDRGCPEHLILDLITQHLAEYSLSPDQLDAIASIDIKKNELALLEIARRFDLPLLFASATQLHTMQHRLTERSAIVFREVGCYGVAEAAALLQAQALAKVKNIESVELMMSKKKNKRATFALAKVEMRFS